MKLLLTLSILLIGLSKSDAQTYPLIDDPCTGLPDHNAQEVEIHSLEELPTRIQFICDRVLDSATLDFRDKIRFTKGQIIDVESWLKNDSIPQTEYNYVMPTYQLYFELSDTTVGIKNFCFELSMDQYGQVTRLEWPREYYRNRADFISQEEVYNTARKYARKKGYKTEKCEWFFVYDDRHDKLCWRIAFLQKSEGDEYNYFKKYKVIVIDAVNPKVIEELDMGSTAVSCG